MAVRTHEKDARYLSVIEPYENVSVIKTVKPTILRLKSGNYGMEKLSERNKRIKGLNEIKFEKSKIKTVLNYGKPLQKR